MLVGDLNRLNNTVNVPEADHRPVPEQRLLQQLVLDSIEECLSYMEKGVIPDTAAEDAEQVYRDNVRFLKEIDEHYLSYAGFKKKDRILTIIASIPEQGGLYDRKDQKKRV